MHLRLMCSRLIDKGSYQLRAKSIIYNRTKIVRKDLSHAQEREMFQQWQRTACDSTNYNRVERLCHGEEKTRAEEGENWDKVSMYWRRGNPASKSDSKLTSASHDVTNIVNRVAHLRKVGDSAKWEKYISESREIRHLARPTNCSTIPISHYKSNIW